MPTADKLIQLISQRNWNIFFRVAHRRVVHWDECESVVNWSWSGHFLVALVTNFLDHNCKCCRRLIIQSWQKISSQSEQSPTATATMFHSLHYLGRQHFFTSRGLKPSWWMICTITRGPNNNFMQNNCFSKEDTENWKHKLWRTGTMQVTCSDILFASPCKCYDVSDRIQICTVYNTNDLSDAIGWLLPAPYPIVK